jgi:MFS family permease
MRSKMAHTEPTKTRPLQVSKWTNTLGGLTGTKLQWAVGVIGMRVQVHSVGNPVNLLPAASCGFWLYGYDMSVMGALLTEEPFLSVFPETKNSTVQGIVIAAFDVGALFGSLACLEVGDRCGRRATVWFGMIFMIIGGVLQTSAWTTAQLTVGRILSGFGNGFQVATIPTWQSECCKAKTRGSWVMIEGGMLTTGLACGQWVGYGFFFTKGQVQWRGPVGIQLIPAIIVFALIMVSKAPTLPGFLPPPLPC